MDSQCSSDDLFDKLSRMLEVEAPAPVAMKREPERRLVAQAKRRKAAPKRRVPDPPPSKIATGKRSPATPAKRKAPLRASKGGKRKATANKNVLRRARAKSSKEAALREESREIAESVRVDTAGSSMDLALRQLGQHLERFEEGLEHCRSWAAEGTEATASDRAALELVEIQPDAAKGAHEDALALLRQRVEENQAARREVMATTKALSAQIAQLKLHLGTLIDRYNYQVFMLAHHTLPTLSSNVERRAEIMERPGYALVPSIFRD